MKKQLKKPYRILYYQAKPLISCRFAHISPVPCYKFSQHIFVKAGGIWAGFSRLQSEKPSHQSFICYKLLSICGCGTEGDCMTPENGLLLFHKTDRREFQSHQKQSWQAGREYIHSRKTLIGCWNPNNGKGAARGGLFIAPTGWLRVLRTLSNTKGESPFPSRLNLPYSAPARARSRATCGALGKGSAAPLAGGFGAAPSKQFEQFSHSKKWANAQRCVPLCTACHN